MGLLTATNRNIGGIEIDATIRESHTSSVTVTNNPVEFGADINDHRIIQPKQVQIEGGVTNNPFGLPDFSSFFGSSESRVSSAWEALEDLQETGEPIDVQTGLKLYTSMLITNLRVAQDVNSSEVLLFTADLTEVRIIETELTTFPSSSLAEGDTASQATSGNNKGQIQTQAVPANSSFLSDALSSLGAF